MGWATIYAIDVAPVEDPSLEILDVDETLDDLARVSGPGSKKVRESLLARMFGRATEAEQRFLRGSHRAQPPAGSTGRSDGRRRRSCSGGDA